MTKVKILVLGPTECGKTRISNYLAEITDNSLPEEFRPTCGVRILEFDVTNLKTDNYKNVEVELWDCSGDEKYVSCWAALKKGSNGIIFVYSPNNPTNIKKLDSFYNYFVNQGITPRQCIVFSCLTDQADQDIKSIKLSSNFSKLSHVAVNLNTAGEKLRYDFNQFLTTIVNNM